MASNCTTTRTEIIVECKNSILGDSVFWRGTPERVGEIRNIPARETALAVAKDGKARQCGMWHVRVIASPATGPLSNEERDELSRLRALINTPQTADWFTAVEYEAAHQQERHGSEHDAGKTPEDWIFLAGHLTGKAAASLKAGDREKGLHHIVSSSASLLNWFRNITGQNTRMRPGIDPAKPPTQTAVQAAAPEPCYSLDEENFNHEDLADVLQALDDQGALMEGATFYEGEAVRHAPSYYFDIDSLIEGMGERAYDDAGEYADTFPDLTKEKAAELRTMVATWLDANVEVRFYSVLNTRKATVTADMLAEHRGAPEASSQQGAQE